MSLRIGNKDVGPIAFGLMGLTASNPPAPYDIALQCMKAALRNGSNFWNGGQFYGPMNANSLQLLHHYFTTYPEDKEKVAISMKGAFSFQPLGPDNRPENIRRSIDNCLEVLDGKAFIDIWQPARLDPKVEIESTIGAIAEYVKAGKIGGIGLSECNESAIRRAHAVHPISAVEVELSLFTTDPLTNGIASTCAELGIPIIAYSPLAKGFLTGQIKSAKDLPETDQRRALPRLQADVFDANMKLVEEVKKVSERKGCTMSQVAIGWLRGLSDRPGMPCIIPLPGASSVKRVNENLKVIVMDEQDMQFLDDAVARFPIQGNRYPDAIQQFSAA
ncbi:aldo-keto reductase, putative [Paecilomyces variotii No. 5]|uniref:Aldo-keto reductase, putative n=1 Tax=Byssochlamys spectabilis (strain No. 5 / NBRC 109023) TaxID=1356009 RepID=V5FWD4_BYSSN|nr:aldo-keto reductase, putative [Paecilomyces variotii No. 5]